MLCFDFFLLWNSCFNLFLFLCGHTHGGKCFPFTLIKFFLGRWLTIIIEGLYIFKDKSNDKYFTLLMKFVILFRECYDVSKNKENTGTKEAVTNKLTPEGLPDLCNEFYGEFMEPNNFFGIEDQDDKNEIIEIIQHFCIWLFKNEYTKSKLSLVSSS